MPKDQSKTGNGDEVWWGWAPVPLSIAWLLIHPLRSPVTLALSTNKKLSHFPPQPDLASDQPLTEGLWRCSPFLPTTDFLLVEHIQTRPPGVLISVPPDFIVNFHLFSWAKFLDFVPNYSRFTKSKGRLWVLHQTAAKAVQCHWRAKPGVCLHWGLNVTRCQWRCTTDSMRSCGICLVYHNSTVNLWYIVTPYSSFLFPLCKSSNQALEKMSLNYPKWNYTEPAVHSVFSYLVYSCHLSPRQPWSLLRSIPWTPRRKWDVSVIPLCMAATPQSSPVPISQYWQLWVAPDTLFRVGQKAWKEGLSLLT